MQHAIACWMPSTNVKRRSGQFRSLLPASSTFCEQQMFRPKGSAKQMPSAESSTGKPTHARSYFQLSLEEFQARKFLRSQEAQHMLTSTQNWPCLVHWF